MTEILKRINESGLSPNQYFLIFALTNKLDILNFDIETEKLILEEKGYIEGNELVNKELNEQALNAKAIQFSRYFPPIRLPSGVHARGRLYQIKQKLSIFLQQYSYDWDTIFQATEKYVHFYRSKGYMYMQNASNFILDKNGDSTLALECDSLAETEAVDNESI